MEPIEILIKKKLDTKVLEGLDFEGSYSGVHRTGYVQQLSGKGLTWLKEDFTHIYLPLTVTQEMVEKGANKWLSKNGDKGRYHSFKAGIDFLLSLTKDKE